MLNMSAFGVGRGVLSFTLLVNSSLKVHTISARLFSSTAGIRTVGVVGMGLMGHGIAQLACQNNFKVLAYDSNSAALSKGLSAIETSLTKLYSKEFKVQTELENKVKGTLKNLTSVTDLQRLADADIVIEAIIENLDIKKSFYKTLSNVVSRKTILASNTSSFPITEIASVCKNGENVVGLHFFNPVQVMQLVEVIKTDKTSEVVFNSCFEFIKQVNKTPVVCNDTPGFIVNRLLVPYLIQSIELLERGDAKKEDIDTAMKLGAGHPMGPLQLADYVGLDTVLAIMSGWKTSYPNNPDFRLPKLLQNLVQNNKLGRKTGEGFYKWQGNKLL